jgi:hypothetical protein
LHGQSTKGVLDMKKLWIVIVGVLLMVGVLGSMPANATSITTVKTTDTTLTVVFGTPTEFDAVPLVKTTTTARSAAALKTTTNEVTEPVNPVTAVPEPSTLILLGLGALGLLGLSRRKKN